MNAKIENGEFWGAHAYSMPASAFCGDELLVNVATRGVVSFEKSSRRQNAFASTLQACAPQKIVATPGNLSR
jgi:hypothetical protein